MQSSNLSERFRSLKAKRSPLDSLRPSLQVNASTRDDDVGQSSPTLEELLAELHTEDDYHKITRNELTEANKLLEEANSALGSTGICTTDHNTDRESLDEEPTEDAQLTFKGVTGERENGAEEEVEAALLLQRLDEVGAEKDHFGARNDDSQKPNSNSPRNNDDVDAESHQAGQESLLLPSAPSHVPPPQLRTDTISFPTAPTAPPRASVSTTAPKFADAEVDSWCIICLTDATVRCQGCAGDLYCNMCWKEGHIGPDAGYEERRHKAVALQRAAAGST